MLIGHETLLSRSPFNKLVLIMKNFIYKLKGVALIVAFFSFLSFVTTADAATTGDDSAPIPTVFVHGLKGSPKSTNGMIAYFSRHYYGAARVQTINIQPNGELDVKGDYQWIDHPLIQINFVNRNASIPQDNVWLAKALHYIKVKDGVKRYDAVGHSAGCVTLLQTEMVFRSRLPIMEKFVSVAGCYNGLLKENDFPHAVKLDHHYRPDHWYPADSQYPAFSTLVHQARRFPKATEVLNIYGDLGDGSNSDGKVTTQSALSLNYILRHQLLKIKNVRFTGPLYKHSGLRKSPVVYQCIGTFLWHQQAVNNAIIHQQPQPTAAHN